MQRRCQPSGKSSRQAVGAFRSGGTHPPFHGRKNNDVVESGINVALISRRQDRPIRSTMKENPPPYSPSSLDFSFENPVLSDRWPRRESLPGGAIRFSAPRGTTRFPPPFTSCFPVFTGFQLLVDSPVKGTIARGNTLNRSTIAGRFSSVREIPRLPWLNILFNQGVHYFQRNHPLNISFNPPSILPLDVQTIVVDLPSKSGTADAEDPARFPVVAAGALQNLDDVIPFHFFQTSQRFLLVIPR